MEAGRMNKALLLGCVAVWVVGGAERATAQESIPPRWEYKRFLSTTSALPRRPSYSTT